MEATLIERNSTLVNYLASQRIKLTGDCQVSAITPKKTRKGNAINIAIQDIYFTFQGKEYKIDHIWLQEVDYPGYFKPVLWEEYYIEFSFYAYRDKVDVNMCGIEISHIELY